MAAGGPATSVVEDYLKAVYAHTEWQDEPATGSDLVARLGLAPSSVTEMVQKLAARGLVEHERYGAVRLTAEGRRRALQVVRRHRLIETWLVVQFGYSADEVHDEAEVLEHAVSDRLLAAIDTALGHPAADPHGDPIPAADGTVVVPDAVRADALDDRREHRVVRISDRDPQVVRDLIAAGVEVGATVRPGALGAAASAVWLAPA